MTLLSMLIALIIERLAVRSMAWQWASYFRHYLRVSERGGLAQWSTHPLLSYVWWLLPAALITVGLQLTQFWLFQLVLNVLVLLLCLGCWHYRQRYKQYLNALARNDQEAAFLLMEQIRTEQGSQALAQETAVSGASQLVWLNFRYYAAVLFWYMLLGVFGAVAYASLRQLSEPLTTQASEDNAENSTKVQAEDDSVPSATAVPEPVALYLSWQQQARQWLHWADFLPARLFGLGLALVGDFSRTSALLLQQAGDLTMPASLFYSRLAQVAEPLYAPTDAAATEAANDSRFLQQQAVAAVQLAKRNVLFFLALVAILTLSGWLG